MADTANTPDVRLSPDGDDVAIRNVTGHPVLKWRTVSGLWLSDKEVADWTPLVPESHHATEAAALRAQS